MNQAPHEDELHAYADGLLDDAELPRIEAHLARSPEDAARVHAWRAQNQALHRLFDPVLSEPVPEHLLPRSGRRSWFALPGGRLAAGLAWLAVGVTVGWLARGPAPAPAQPPLAQVAAGAHRVYAVEVKHPVEVEASQEAHLVAWLSKRLGHPLAVPDLGDQGYALLGGRLLPDDGRAAAQFMYQADNGRRLTLYVTVLPGSSGETGFRFAQEGGLGVFYWVDGRFGYALAGDESRTRLQALAQAAWNGLSGAGVPQVR